MQKDVRKAKHIPGTDTALDEAENIFNNKRTEQNEYKRENVNIKPKELEYEQ